MKMVQRKFYLPYEMYRKLEVRAKIYKKTITAVLRETIEEGLKKKELNSAGTHALLELVNKAEKEGLSGPSDLALQHDKYFIEVEEKQRRKQQKKV